MKKVLSIILINIIVASFCALSVPINAATEYYIDPTQKGTIKLYKYEMDDVDDATQKNYQNQTTISSSIGATPLKGVTFTAKRVVGIEGTEGNTNVYYYDSSGTKKTSNLFTQNSPALPSVSSVQSYKRIKADGTASGLAVNNSNVTTDLYTGKTDANGYITWTNIPLGIYLVEEQKSPSHVTGRAQPFMVSVPWTSLETDHSKWQYTAYVYPKNQTAYQELKIHKTDAVTNANIQNTSFTIGSAASNTSATENEAIGPLTATTDSNGIAVFPSLPVNRTYTLKESKAAPGYTLAKTASKRTWYIYLDDEGFAYFVSNATATTGSKINGVAYDITLSLTNSKPTITKGIDLNKGATPTALNTRTAATFGQNNSKANFVYYIDVKTPSAQTTPSSTSTNSLPMSEYNSFKVTDTITNATSTIDKVVDTSVSGGQVLTAGANTYSASKTTNSNNDTWTISFSTSNSTTIKNNTTYRIFFSVKYITSRIGQDNTNTATVSYQGLVDNTNSPVRTLTSNQTSAFSTGYYFTKTNTSNTPLQGVTYKLYPTLSDAQNNTNAITAYNATTNSYTTNFTSNLNGVVKIGFINNSQNTLATQTTNKNQNRTYYLAETKTVEGYSLIKDPIEITVTPTSYNSSQMTIKNASNLLLPYAGGISYPIIIISGFALFLICIITIIIIKKRNKAQS